MFLKFEVLKPDPEVICEGDPASFYRLIDACTSDCFKAIIITKLVDHMYCIDTDVIAHEGRRGKCQHMRM